MKSGDLFDDATAPDDAVINPVLSVILVVAVTVVLTALVSTVVLGLDDQVSQSPPQATFTFNYDNDATGPDSFGVSGGSYEGLLVVTHSGGSTVEAGRLYVTGASSTSGARSWGARTTSAPQYDDERTVAPGDQLTVWIDADDTVRVTWVTESGANSVTLNTWKGVEN